MTTTQTPGTTAVAQESDAVAFLIGQHMAIRDLFSEVTKAHGEQRKAAFEQLVRLLAVHETAEEQVLRPVTRAVVDGGNAIADARVAEEREAKEMLVALEKLGPDSPDFAPMLEQLRQAVLEHAHNEEAYEFRYLKQHGQTGEPMTAMIKASEAIAPTHPHPSVNSAVANTLTGPVVGMFDRARDLFRKALNGHGS
jgi:hemerythrin superfamily protein